MVTVTVICVLMTTMAYAVMLMMNRQIAVLQEEINEMYSEQGRHESRIENCEEILLDTAKKAGRHEQQYANIIAKQKETERKIERIEGYVQ